MNLVAINTNCTNLKTRKICCPNCNGCICPTIVVALISSAKKNDLPVHIHICSSETLPKDSVILTEQLRTIDRRRLRKYVGSLNKDLMIEINGLLKISIGVNDND